jgi:ERCC4-type nuclease
MRAGVSATGSKYRKRAASAGILKEYKLKPFQFPEDMIVVVDTREQKSPLFTRYPKGLTVSSATLTTGDYSLKGLESCIAVERKQLSDLISYCTWEYEKKTRAKMEKMKELEFAGLIIEARESEIYSPYEYAPGVSVESVRQALVAFQVKYGVHVYIGNKENCCRVLLDNLIMFWKLKHAI